MTNSVTAVAEADARIEAEAHVVVHWATASRYGDREVTVEYVVVGADPDWNDERDLLLESETDARGEGLYLKPDSVAPNEQPFGTLLIDLDSRYGYNLPEVAELVRDTETDLTELLADVTAARLDRRAELDSLIRHLRDAA